MSTSRIALLLVATLICTACPPREELPRAAPQIEEVEGITYSAELRIAETFPVTLYTTAFVHNATTDAREVTFPDGCIVLLRAYRDAARTGDPAWDQARAVACTQALQTVELSPGEAEQFQGRATAAEILGDSLPAGRYYLTAYLRPDGQQVELGAGEADLRQ